MANGRSENGNVQNARLREGESCVWPGYSVTVVSCNLGVVRLKITQEKLNVAKRKTPAILTGESVRVSRDATPTQ